MGPNWAAFVLKRNELNNNDRSINNNTEIDSTKLIRLASIQKYSSTKSQIIDTME
jgi:hypothetical protein